MKLTEEEARMLAAAASDCSFTYQVRTYRGGNMETIIKRFKRQGWVYVGLIRLLENGVPKKKLFFARLLQPGDPKPRGPRQFRVWHAMTCHLPRPVDIRTHAGEDGLHIANVRWNALNPAGSHLLCVAFFAGIKATTLQAVPRVTEGPLKLVQGADKRPFR